MNSDAINPQPCRFRECQLGSLADTNAEAADYAVDVVDELISFWQTISGADMDMKNIMSLHNIHKLVWWWPR